jgi:lysophospholipase L1-like esterase
MPLSPAAPFDIPDFWNVFGHSYMQYAFGTFYQTGRADALFFATMDVEPFNKRNYAVNGSRACIEGYSTGGFARFYKGSKKPQRGGPYVANGGAALFCYGVNDLGLVGFTTQVKTAFQHAMRAMISRWRLAVIYENDFLVGTRTSYGAGFGSIAAVGYTSNDTAHWCTATTNANFTLTLPSDYGGEIVAVTFVGAGGVSGGVVTWGGTAGATGTTSTSNILPSAAVSHCPVTKRFVNGSGQSLFTSANAGQTITGTVNTLDAGGAVMLDFWGLEAQNPSPIIVCNTARLTAAGYTGNYPSWTGTEASRDQDVVDLNANLTSVVAEFDSMVQIADIDSIINKQASFLFSDGLHPNEFGAAAIVDAIADARKRLRPTNAYKTRNFNVPAPRSSAFRKPRLSGSWYTANHVPPTSTGSIGSVGDLWAIPVVVTEATEFWNRLAFEVVSSAGAGTIRWGIYDDVGWTGYPQEIVAEPTAASGALSTGVAAAAILSPTVGNGSFQTVMDPGLYWIGFLVVTTGTTTVLRTLQGPNGIMSNVTTTGAIGAMTAANAPNGWKSTGVATTAMPTSFPSGAVATGSAPYVGFQVNINATN